MPMLSRIRWGVLAGVFIHLALVAGSLAFFVCPLPARASESAIPTSITTSTVMIFDTSGSMNWQDASGVSKLEAAKSAGLTILDILRAENAVAEGNNGAEVGIVDFNTTARVDSGLTTDMEAASSALTGLTAGEGTGMPDGLRLSLDLIANRTSGSKGIIILMTDGVPNIGLGGNTNLEADQVKQQVLDLASEAGQSGICIYTVGFGIPGAVEQGEISLDEDFLRQIPVRAGCGEYYNAQNAYQLASVYVKLRHSSTGTILLEKSGTISTGERVEIGNAQVPAGQSQILGTIYWGGSRLELQLTDPAGIPVDLNYPGAYLASSTRAANIVVNNPPPGLWKVVALGIDVPEGTTPYYAVISTRMLPVTFTPVVPTPSIPAPIPSPPMSGMTTVLLLGLIIGAALIGYVYVHSNARKDQKSSARLVALNGLTYPLTTENLIGRGSTCQIRLPDRKVSRRHARIYLAQGSWYIQDLGSSGGTFVNGVQIQTTPLQPGDRVTIGPDVLTFYSD